MPVGPLKLSIQPGKGSCQDATTMDGLTMASGRPLDTWPSIPSVMALVNVYVLGCEPIIVLVLAGEFNSTEGTFLHKSIMRSASKSWLLRYNFSSIL